MRHDVSKLARELGVDDWQLYVVGSTLICGTGNDLDVLGFEIPDDVMLDLGFIPEGEAYADVFMSWRRDADKTNLLVTDDRAYFAAEMAAAVAARLVNGHTFDMSQRDDRVDFHRAIREEVSFFRSGYEKARVNAAR